MKTRTKVELLKLMLDNINLLRSGLCTLNTTLLASEKINGDEHTMLRSIIDDNETWYYPLRSDSYYWDRGKFRPRKRWLNKMIKKYEKED